MKRISYIILLVLFATLGVQAQDSEIRAEADRPGMGTGTTVLPYGSIQWETGFEVDHLLDMHELCLPTTLFRLGLGPWAELRLEYTGVLLLDDDRKENPMADVSYMPEPLWIGSKIRLWGGSEEPKLKWIPRVSLLLEAGVPLTRFDAQYHPLCGTIDLLFENDITDWLSLGYDLGVYWLDWAPTPDVFASLGFNFSPTDKLGVFIESYNYFDPDAVDEEDPKRTFTVCDISLDFGLTYMVHPRVQLDAYAGFNLYHTEPVLSGPRNNVYFGFGVAWLLHHC